jgi:hypothetical protein
MHVDSARLSDGKRHFDLSLLGFDVSVLVQGCEIPEIGSQIGQVGYALEVGRAVPISEVVDLNGRLYPSKGRPAIIRKHINVWEVRWSGNRFLTGYSRRVELCRFTVVKEVFRVTVEATTYPKDLGLIMDDSPTSETKLKILKLFLRRMLARNGDRLIIGRATLEGDGEYF